MARTDGNADQIQNIPVNKTDPTNGQVLTYNSTSGEYEPTTEGSGFSDPMTTRGDIIYKNATNMTTRLPIGTSGQVIVSNGTDLAYENQVGGGNVSTSGTPVDDDFAKFVNGTDIEGRNYSEVKTDLSLGNVDNTSDANKPVSTAAQTALDAKVGDTGDETVAGVKTFSSFPVTPSSAPTTNYQIANKKYVDDNSGGSTNPTISNKTADYSILSGDSGIIFTNEGASEAIEFLLPTAVAGLNNKFAVKNTNSIRIRPHTGDSIFDKDSNETTSIKFLVANSKGAFISIYALDSSNWFIDDLNAYTIVSDSDLYGFFGGGTTGSVSNIIDYIILATAVQNATDTGDLSVARRELAGVYGSTYGFFGGGWIGSSSNVIDYITLATAVQNATDTGDLSVARNFLAGVSGSTYGFFGGGWIGSSSNVIDYITLATAVQNATDTGDLSVARTASTGVYGSTYGFFGGSSTPADVIDYITLATAVQNATDTGGLTVARGYLAGVSGSTYGFFGGGWIGSSSNVIDYITLATAVQNATDTGDLTVAREYLAGVSGSTYGFFGGGRIGSSSNVIDYITLATAVQNATDTGDLTVARMNLSGM